jgi:hypothetical protein
MLVKLSDAQNRVELAAQFLLAEVRRAKVTGRCCSIRADAA